MSTFSQRVVVHIFLLLTLLLTTFLHLWRLPEFPPSISGDEAYNGLEVLLLMKEPKLIALAPSNAGREAMFHYMLMLPIAIFGPTAFALRLWPALAGILIVALTYRWVRALLPLSSSNHWVALLSAIFMATSFWHLQITRLGLRGILLVLFMLGSYLFFWWGYQHQQMRWFIWSGLFLGLTVHTYPASRPLPLTFILFVVAVTIFYRRSTRRAGVSWRGLMVTGLVSMIVFAPLGWYFFNHPGALLFRSGQVSLRSAYELHYPHTGQSFANFVWQAWDQNLRWFVELSTPWLQNYQLPAIFSWLALLFWIGLLRALYLARRHAGYAFLLISFGVGILPIFFGQPTAMRVIAAMPPTYALLAIGAYFPLELLENRSQNFDLSLTAAVTAGILLVSALSVRSLFEFNQWVGPPPLPTEFSHAFDLSAHRIRDLVLNEQQSVLVPQEIYGYPPAQFVLQDGFAPPLPVDDPSLLSPTEMVTVFWPAEWSQWFENKPPSFVLLSPGADGHTGYIETIGQWEQSVADFETAAQAQYTLPQTEVLINETGRTIAYIFTLPRQQVLNMLRSTPENPVQINFNDEMTLLGYDVRFLSEQKLDIGLFWRGERNILEDHHLVMQLVDQRGQIVVEKLGAFSNPTAAWYPGQLNINHHLFDLPKVLEPGSYALKIGLIKANYKEEIMTKLGEWMPVFSPTGVRFDEPIIPLGLIQVGEPPAFVQDVDVIFDNKINLTGYRLDRGARPDTFRVSLRWQALQPISKDYTITLQLFDENEKLVAQIDSPPLGGAYPTTAWFPARQILNSYDLQLPETLPGGVYHLAIGVYDLQSLQRLPLSKAVQRLPEQNLAVIQKIVLD